MNKKDNETGKVLIKTSVEGILIIIIYSVDFKTYFNLNVVRNNPIKDFVAW